MKYLTILIILFLLFTGVNHSGGFMSSNKKSSFLTSPHSHNSRFISLIPKLTAKKNTFILKENQPLVSQAFAAADYTQAPEYIAIDTTSGKVIEEKNESVPVPIASLTKLMTAIVALDLASPEELFSVSQHASLVSPTTIGVVPGEKMTLEELLHGMLMTSANDAAQVVYDGVNAKYQENIFLQAMNEKAKFLGLIHSHFDNPQGFDSASNFSSAHDLAILAHYALTNYPLISTIVKKDYQFLPQNENHKQFDLYNWNGLLDVYPDVYGVKIGNTNAAGTTTIVGSKRNGKDVLAVLLGAPGILQRDLWTSEILDDAYQKEYGFSPMQITAEQLNQKYATWK